MNDEYTIKLSGIWKEDEWLYFECIEYKSKTNVFSVISKSSDIELGKIKWHPAWRHYCFFPTTEEETVYSDRCLLSISEFLTEMNNLHKEKQTKEKNGRNNN
jgi:hypothetical protein